MLSAGQSGMRRYEEMTPCYSFWEIPWTGPSKGLQSMGVTKVGHDLVTKRQVLADVYKTLCLHLVLSTGLPENIYADHKKPSDRDSVVPSTSLGNQCQIDFSPILWTWCSVASSCIVYNRRLAVILCFSGCLVSPPTFHDCFNIFSLMIIFIILITVCRAVFSCWSTSSCGLVVSWICRFIVYIKKFFCAYLCSSHASIMHVLGCLIQSYFWLMFCVYLFG